jgi:hypothetical protein
MVEERSYDETGRLLRIEQRLELVSIEPDGPLHTEQRYHDAAAGRPLDIETWSLDGERAVLLERTVYDLVCRVPGS